MFGACLSFPRSPTSREITTGGFLAAFGLRVPSTSPGGPSKTTQDEKPFLGKLSKCSVGGEGSLSSGGL